MNGTPHRDADSTPANITDVLSGILTLAANEGEQVPIAKIHSVLYEMKPHEIILAGLKFSLKGDVCYSKNIHRAIDNLVVWGFLKIVDGSTVSVERIHPFRTYLSGFLSNSQLQAIHSASLRYYDRLHGSKNRAGAARA